MLSETISIYMPVRYIDEVGALYESKIGNIEQLEQDTSSFKDSGPEAADNFEPVEVDPKKKRKNSVLDEDKLSNNVEEKEKKAVKKEQAEINNSTMRQNSNISSFDKLFEDVMGDDVPMDFGADMGGGHDDLGDELGGEDEENGTVTLELDRELAEQLHSLLGGVLDSGEEVEDIEDIDSEDHLGDDDELAPESHVIDAMETGPQDAVSKLATQNGGNNKAGDVTPVGAAQDGSAGGQEDGGKPKAAPDSVASLTGKNNKVGGKLTPGKHAFKA
tara:strand:- start:28 stop:849 length:822 start_codon:yes stop_codon:yes gene_type:complete